MDCSELLVQEVHDSGIIVGRKTKKQRQMRNGKGRMIVEETKNCETGTTPAL